MMRQEKLTEMRHRIWPSAFSLQPSAFIFLPSAFSLLLFLASAGWGQPQLSASSLNSGGGRAASGSVYQFETTLGQSGVVGFSEWGDETYQIAWGFQAFGGVPGEPPRIITATVSDVNDNGIIEPGDQLVLTLDRSVIVTTHVLQASHFFLPVQSDSLGRTNFSVHTNPHNLRQIALILGGPTVRLTAAGDFSMTRRTPGSPSGIDFATSLPLGAIVSLEGIAAVDGGEIGVDDFGVDIQMSLVKRSVVIGRSGGTLSVGVSPDAAYTHHEIQFLPDTVATPTTFLMRPPFENLGVIGAVQIGSSIAGLTFKPPAFLWIEYREGDIDWDSGQVESTMRIHQLVESPRGVFRYEPVPGNQTLSDAPPLVPFRETGKFDTTPRQVMTPLTSLNPCNSLGPGGIFAGLPIETVDERTVNMKPEGGGLVRRAGSVIITPGPRSSYKLHQIEIPNYMLTSESDPQRLVVKMRKTELAERYSPAGGRSFPSLSGAVFTMTVTNASSQPVAFTDPVHITVQFKIPPDPGAPTDLVYFDGRPAMATGMGIVRDLADGEPVNFGPVSALPQIVDTALGTVTVQNLVGLTGADGRGTFGAAGSEGQTPAANWQLYP